MKRLPLALAAAALTLAGPAAAAVSNGTYKGNTNQNFTVHAKVKNGKIASLSFGVSTRCGIGGSGAYKHSEKGDSSNGKATYTLKGKVTKGKITGSIEQFFRGGCQTFDLKFTA